MRLPRCKSLPLGVHLVIVVASAMIPLLFFSVTLVNELASSKQDLVRRNLLDEARNLANDLDLETESTIRALKALGESSTLQSGDLKTFYEVVSRVLHHQTRWLSIIHIGKDGSILLNTEFPFGKQPTAPVEPVSVHEALSKEEVVLGRLAKGGDVYAVPIRVPVRVNGVVKYLLTAVISTAGWQSVVTKFPSSPEIWTKTVVDKSGVIIARSRAPDEFIGKIATPPFLDRMKSSSEAIAEDTTLEGTPVVLAHTHSKLAGWTVAAAAPRSVLFSSVTQSVLMLVTVGLLLLALFSLVGFSYGYSIAKGIRDLSKAARDVVRGQKIRRVQSRVREISELGDALLESESLLAQREQERQKVLGNLQESQRQAEEANEAKDRFLAMLGHELRNPMGAVTNAVEVLKELRPAEDEESKALQDIIDRQLKVANTLMDDLLDASRISRGKVHLRLETLDLKALVAGTVTDCKHLFTTKGIEIQNTCCEEPVWIHGDRGRIVQTIGNLLHNACKFTPTGGKVTVSLTSDGARCFIRVLDSGCGFDDKILPKLFEPFAQAEQDFARSQGGFGLGLAVVKGLVELHGGCVAAQNRADGSGAEIIVTLPQTLPLDCSNNERLLSIDCRSQSILLVEDNIDFAFSLRQMLEREGHSVKVVHRGLEALAVLAEQLPDTVICDLGLPDIDGFEVCRRIREVVRQKFIRVIALSGYAQLQDRCAADDAGFDCHLAKPVNKERLREALCLPA